MRRRGILHADLSRHLGLLGHTDRVAVGDMGLPLPAHVPRVDLALLPGQVPFTVVLDALLDELVIEAHVVAEESAHGAAGRWLDERADRLGARRTVTHARLKEELATVRVAIRTGEATPYANVILESGVPF